MNKKILNVKGLRCPIPVLKAEKVLKKLKTGDILEVLTTDPQAIKDFHAFCEVNYCLFLSSNQKNAFGSEIIKTKKISTNDGLLNALLSQY